MAVQPESRASTPQCMAEMPTDSAGVFTKLSSPCHPSSPRGSCRISCCTHSSSGSGLMSPRAQCSIECVWALTNPGRRMRSLQSMPVSPSVFASPILAIFPSDMRTSFRAYFPSAAGRSTLERSVLGGAWGIARKVDAMPGPGTVHECLDIFRRLLAAAYDMSLG